MTAPTDLLAVHVLYEGDEWHQCGCGLVEPEEVWEQNDHLTTNAWWATHLAAVIEAHYATELDRVRADVLERMADEIENGVTFPVPPAVISQLVRERAATYRATE